MTKMQWRYHSCLQWLRRNRWAISEIFIVSILAIFLGIVTTCHARKIEASFEGYQFKGIYASKNGFEVLYQKDDQIFSAIFPDKSHAECFAEAIK